LWSFDTNTNEWTYIGGSQTSNNEYGGYPNPRCLAISWYSPSSNTFYMYGGISSAGPYGDLWKYSKGTWKQLSGPDGVTVTFTELFDPGNRVGAASWIHGNNLYILGGQAYSGN
jgi:hypothetical protein